MAISSQVRDMRQDTILAAATVVLARQGFCEMRMEDIAHEAGLSKRSLAQSFRSKGLLIAAILHQFYAQGLQDLRLLETSTTPASKRVLLLTHYMVAGLKQLAELLPIRHVSTARPGCQEEVRECLSEYFRGYRQALVALIQAGAEQGEFSMVDPEAAATMLALLYEGQAALWAVDPIPAKWEDISKQIIQTFLAGLRVNSSSSALAGSVGNGP